MTEINLEGKGAKVEKYKVPVDTYVGKIVEVSDVIKSPTFKDPNVMEEKIVFTLETTHKKQKVRLPLYAKNRISKGSGQYSNSKLFDILEALGLLDEVSANTAELTDNEKFVGFLRGNAVGKEVKFLTKNSKDKQGEEYSRVDKLLSLAGDGAEEHIEE